jgi:YebC/PmpR family DNA-binding regulatory protein
MGRKWANIKDKKASLDKARGQIYTRLLKDITAATKKGGQDPDNNFLLKLALQKCRVSNVPKDNIERAIKKGMGDDMDDYKDIAYEGYGPGGVSVFVDASTNNPTRTIANIRTYFKKVGGEVGKDGCLQFIFERKSVFEIGKPKNFNEDDFTLEVIDAGAGEVEVEGDDITVMGKMEDFGTLSKKLDEMGVEVKEAGLERIPLIYKKLDKENFEILMRLVGWLEEDDDVLKVYHNTEYDPAFDE